MDDPNQPPTGLIAAVGVGEDSGTLNDWKGTPPTPSAVKNPDGGWIGNRKYFILIMDGADSRRRGWGRLDTHNLVVIVLQTK